MPRPPALAVVLAAVLLGAGVFGAGAQVIGPGTTTSTTAPPSSEPTTTTTTEPQGPVDPLFPSTTTTTAPPPGTPPDQQPPAQAPVGGGDAPPPPGTPQVVPPEYQALINSVKRSRGNDTRRLLEALRPLMELGLTEAEAIAAGFGRFPVGGHATFGDHWWLPRFVPTFHLHEGTDIFAAAGTPVRSPLDGVLKMSSGPVGGLASYVYADDGTYVYMSHLSGYPEGLTTGQRVKVGDNVGFVGDTGNARGGSPHVHFEIHPAPTKTVTTGRGRNRVTTEVTRPVAPGTSLPPVNPKPYLDQWIADAIANAPRVIAALEASRPRAILATGLTRRLGDGRGGVFAGPSTPSRAQLLWASSASPTGGALQLAEAEAAEAAEEVDWDQLAERYVAWAQEWEEADRFARAVVARITPSALHGAAGLEEPD